ncbi:MAG: phosphomannomutase/phosphoglucomutase [Caulobacteraceae bacterium]|nr:phosphomannomutase/phosphoglucomutase [Caulobacter sp.]
MTEAPRPHMRTEAVRAFDIRGVVGRDLDAEDARLLGGAYAEEAYARGLSRIAVARDGRLSSPELEAALVEGLAAGGLEVTRLGIGPTPMLAFATQALAFDGGVMVTASHNPPSHNGFKLFLGGERLSGAALQALARRAPRHAPGGSVGEGSALAAYVAHLRAGSGTLPALRVAWDVGNGAAGAAVRALVAQLPGEHVVLHAEPDGRFPNHHPDPAVAANLADLQAAVVAHGCDLGLAFDGDGDRLGAVDATGAILWADQLLLLLAADVLRDQPGAAVVGDVKCSDALFEGVRALGGRAALAASGYVKVREALVREGASIAGELSGHVFYADLFGGGDDALYAAVRVLKALGRAGETLAAFRARLPRYVSTPELRIPCPESRKAAVVEEVAARLAARGVRPVRVDGVRVSGSDGWWLLRASNTESCVTGRFDGSAFCSLISSRGVSGAP